MTKYYDKPQAIKPSLKQAGSWVMTPLEKANEYAKHLAKVFNPNNTSTKNLMAMWKQFLTETSKWTHHQKQILFEKFGGSQGNSKIKRN